MDTTTNNTATLHTWGTAERQHLTVPVKATEQPRFHSATGYGRKIPTRYMVRLGNRWRRVYACQISNAGTAYVGKPGAWTHVVDSID